MFPFSSLKPLTPLPRPDLQLSFIMIIFALISISACRAASPTPTPTTPLADELILYNWEGDMPQSVLDTFAQEYGVKVNYLTYESQEEAIENMRAGQVYDMVTLESRFIPLLVQEGLLAEIDYHHVPNFRNISANFRDLIYDPGNKHSVPYSWGTTGLVVRSDLVAQPVTRWADLWDPRYAGKVGIWRGQPREVIALTLKSLGYSANSEKPDELEAALQRLRQLKLGLIFLEDFDPDSTLGVMLSGQAVIAMGYVGDVLEGREENPAITYILPTEGALVWGDNFIIPANSSHKYTAELFLNFLLRPEINVQIASANHDATPNEAAYPLIDPDLRNNPLVFPPNEDLQKAEIILPLSPTGQKLYDQTWQRFMDAAPPENP